MKRERYVERIVRDPETNVLVRLPEGTEEAQAYGLALAQVCSARFLEVLYHHIAAINEFGGEFYVGAARAKFYNDELVEHNEPGQHETIGYVVAFNKKAQIRGQAEEPDVARGTQPAPAPDTLRDEIEAEVEAMERAEEVAAE